MFTLENCLCLLANAFRVYTYSRFFRIFYKKHQCRFFIEWIAYLLFFLVNSYVYLQFRTPAFNLTSNLLFVYSIPFLYSRRISYNIGIGSLAYAINMLADCATYFFIDYSIVVQSGMATSLLFFLITLLCELWFRKRTFKRVRGINLFSIFSIPASSITIAVLTMYEYKKEMLIVAALLMFINIVVFYLFASLDKAYMQIHEQALTVQQSKAYMNQLEIVYQAQEQQRFLRHDMKNHLQKMDSLLEQKRYDDLQDYIHKSVEKVSYSKEFVHSGNSDIDSLLNYKLLQAEKSGATVDADVQIPDGLQIDSFDISVLLGNLLDNAIEAIRLEETPILSVCIHFNKKLLFISIQNTCSEEPRWSDGLPVSKKTDHSSEHGIGLRSVQHTLQKYNGNMKFSCENERFTVTLMLYL